MSWTRATLCDLDRGGRGREAWADIAKALSIILLVLWTTVGPAVYANDLLILARMPLFFFVSGLFAFRVVVRADALSFRRDRVGNLVYLYALWTALLFLSTRGVWHVLFDAPLPYWRQLQLFWDPPLTIWFLYALAIAFVLARLLRGLPIWLVTLGVVAAYSAAVWTGDWRDMGFGERLVRLFPFFWLGLASRPLVERFVEAAHRLWPIALAGFFLAAALVLDGPLGAVGPVTLAVSLLGVAALLLLARRLADFRASAPLAIVGASTLYVYVLQRIILFYLDQGFGALGLAGVGAGVTKAVIIVALATVAGRFAAAWPPTAWLFEAPWIRRPTSVAAPA